MTSERFVFKRIMLSDGNPLELDMQIERPQGPGPFPIVFIVHGGGWITGSKAHFCHQSFELVKNGVAAARITYRLMDQGGVYSNVIGDVLDAINFVRKRKSELQLDFPPCRACRWIGRGTSGGHRSTIETGMHLFR